MNLKEDTHPMPKIIFLDTNILLHYRSFDQVNWPKITNSDSVKLIITQVNLRELNSIKDSLAKSWFRNRAKDIQKKLTDYMQNDLTIAMSNKVTLLIEHRDPLINFDMYHLDRNIEDDNLIATILMYRQETPDADIALITSDNGITLLSKARPRSIPTIKMPDDQRLPDEPDTNQEKIKALEKTIRELNSAVPNLSLVFADGNQTTKFSLQKPIAQPGDMALKQKLDEIKQKYPKKNKEISISSENANEVEIAYLFASELYEIEEYNEELEKFYIDCSEYILHNIDFQNNQRRTVELFISLLNKGTAPAGDIDVIMNFPDEIKIFTKEGLPEPLKKPDPPRLKTKIGQLLERVTANNILSSMSYSAPEISTINAQNISHPHIIKDTNSCKVSLHIERLKHTFQADFDTLYLLYTSFDTAKSFHINYKIIAANLPQEVEGKLHIKIEKE